MLRIRPSLYAALSILLGVALLATVVTATVGSRAAFLDTTDNVDSSFNSLSCFEPAQPSSVQSGTTTSNANGTVSVPITPVDPAMSFLVFNSRHNSNRPVGSLIRGRLSAAGNAVEFVRATNESVPVPMAIQWYVVEYSCGIRVQRGEVNQSSTTINVPITPVGSTSQAFVLWSKTPSAGDNNFSEDDPVVSELTAPGNLQFRVNSANSSHVIAWQVVEFVDPLDVSVQRGTTSLLGTSISATVILSPPVDVNKTFILVDYRTAGSGADVGSRMLTAELTSSTTISIDRSISGNPDDITEISWQAVELQDGSSVQHGSEPFLAGAASSVVGISPVDTSKAYAFGSVQAGSGQNMGRSPYAVDDVVGVGSFTVALSANNLTLTRDNTAASADVGWFVVHWGTSPPSISGLSPSSGPAAGGTSVVLSGSGFTGATAVDFGANPATGFTVDSDSQITATSPAGSGTVDVQVTTPSGTSTNTGADDFTYGTGTNVQSGTLTVTGSGTATVAITSVDPGKAFLLFQSRHNGNRPPNSMLRGRIASGTSLEFVRVTNEGPLGSAYKQQLTISVGANAPSGGYSGYTVRITGLDTQSLIAANKMRSDGNDLRVFYWNGSLFLEVDREVRNLDTTDTHVIFQSQTDMAVLGSDTNHYLFYGNPNASAPSGLDTTNVYLWYDDATQNRLSQYITGRGDDWHCCGYVDSIAWDASGYYTYDTGNDITDSMRRAVNERDVLVEAEFYHTGAYLSDMTSGVLSRYQGTGSGATEASTHYYASNRADSPFMGSAGYSHDVSIMKDARGTVAIGPAEGSAAPAIAGNQWRIQALGIWGINDTNGKYWDDDVASDLTRGWPADGVADYLKSGVDPALGDDEGSGDAGVIVAQDAGRVRHILIRRYTEPEPTVTVGGETTIPPIDIQWYVVEIPTGVNVQRGEVSSQSATTINVPITAVAALDQAFVTWSKTPAASDGTLNSDDVLLGELTTTSNLQFRVNSANSSHVIWWQVVEFTNGADINVQKGTTSLLGTATSVSVPLGTPVDPSQTFVLVGYRTAGSGSDMGARMLRAQLIDGSTIQIDRSISGTPDDITEIVWQAVELTNGSSVQRGSASFAISAAQATASITSVNTDRSVAFASVQPVGGQNTGRSPYAADDILGVCSVTMSLSSTQVTMDRNNTAGTCDVGWFVVEFAP